MAGFGKVYLETAWDGSGIETGVKKSKSDVRSLASESRTAFDSIVDDALNLKVQLEKTFEEAKPKKGKWGKDSLDMDKWEKIALGKKMYTLPSVAEKSSEGIGKLSSSFMGLARSALGPLAALGSAAAVFGKLQDLSTRGREQCLSYAAAVNTIGISMRNLGKAPIPEDQLKGIGDAISDSTNFAYTSNQVVTQSVQSAAIGGIETSNLQSFAQVAADLAALPKFGGNLTSASEQLLDLINKGTPSEELMKSGIELTTQQRDYIKTLKDAGREQELQKYVLQTVGKEFSGLAAKTVNASTQMQNYSNEIAEAFGKGQSDAAKGSVEKSGSIGKPGETEKAVFSGIGYAYGYTKDLFTRKPMQLLHETFGLVDDIISATNTGIQAEVANSEVGRTLTKMNASAPAPPENIEDRRAKQQQESKAFESSKTSWRKELGLGEKDSYTQAKEQVQKYWDGMQKGYMSFSEFDKLKRETFSKALGLEIDADALGSAKERISGYWKLFQENMISLDEYNRRSREITIGYYGVKTRRDEMADAQNKIGKYWEAYQNGVITFEEFANERRKTTLGYLGIETETEQWQQANEKMARYWEAYEMGVITFNECFKKYQEAALSKYGISAEELKTDGDKVLDRLGKLDAAANDPDTGMTQDQYDRLRRNELKKVGIEDKTGDFADKARDLLNVAEKYNVDPKKLNAAYKKLEDDALPKEEKISRTQATAAMAGSQEAYSSIVGASQEQLLREEERRFREEQRIQLRSQTDILSRIERILGNQNGVGIGDIPESVV